jgi:CRP-like cAMP-binding protein
MDIVGFSTLFDEDQLEAIRILIKWIRSSLDFQEIDIPEYHWSPAGDGGYLTFKTPSASEKALDVAFSVLEKSKRPTWIPQTGQKIELRFGLHAGIVFEGDELGGGTNIWGDGINMAARVLSVSAGSQVLVSNQYYDAYMRNHRQRDIAFGRPFLRTVKHGVRISIRNTCRGDLGLRESEEINRRWMPIGMIWQKTIESYLHLIDDAIDCDDPIAALAAAKFLLELKDHSHKADGKADHVFSAIGESGSGQRSRLRHSIFNVMPANLLRKVMEYAIPRVVSKREFLCEEGDPADSCYIPIYGALQVEGSNIPAPIEIPPGELIGEFSLWIHNSRRTATIRAKEESLILEIPTFQFAAVCRQSPDLAEKIYLLIRRRLLEIVVKSKHFFADIGSAEMDALLSQPSLVEKIPAGMHLDLTKSTYVLFQGAVKLRPPLLEGKEFEVASKGQFTRETVVGVTTEWDSLIDGDFAEVLEETVLIRFPHPMLLDLFRKHPSIQEVWDGIWGRRYNTLLRIKGSGSTNLRLASGE